MTYCVHFLSVLSLQYYEYSFIIVSCFIFYGGLRCDKSCNKRICMYMNTILLPSDKPTRRMANLCCHNHYCVSETHQLPSCAD